MEKEQIIKKLEAIDKQIQQVLKQLKSEKNTEETAFDRAINKQTTDDVYVEALRELKQQPYGMSVKQFSWIVSYTRFHRECGDVILDFFQSILKKCNNKNEFVELVAANLRKNYTNEYNQDFIEGAIKTLKELANEEI